MSREALEAFCRLVPDEPGLDEALRGPADAQGFAALLTRLALERGFDVSPADVLDALARRRREWLARWP